MDYRDLTVILIKVTGAVIIGYTIVGIPAYMSYFYYQQEQTLAQLLGLSILPMVIPLLLGIILLFFPYTVVNKLVAKSDNESNFEIRHLESIAFSILGMYLLFNAVSDASYHLVSIILASIEGVPYDTGRDHPHALIVTTILEFCFSLYLLFGSQSLVNTLRSFRTIGTGGK